MSPAHHSLGLFSQRRKLQGFHWAGNIRQLMKALDAWILTCEFDVLQLTVENFPVFKGMNESKHSIAPKSVSIGETDIYLALKKDMDLESDRFQ